MAAGAQGTHRPRTSVWVSQQRDRAGNIPTRQTHPPPPEAQPKAQPQRSPSLHSLSPAWQECSPLGSGARGQFDSPPDSSGESGKAWEAGTQTQHPSLMPDLLCPPQVKGTTSQGSQVPTQGFSVFPGSHAGCRLLQGCELRNAALFPNTSTTLPFPHTYQHQTDSKNRKNFHRPPEKGRDLQRHQSPGGLRLSNTDHGRQWNQATIPHLPRQCPHGWATLCRAVTHSGSEESAPTCPL